jgi:hypothetical protein
VEQYLDLWQREMPGFEEGQIRQMAFELGVRESRRVCGLKTFTAEMVSGAVKQPHSSGHGFWSCHIYDPKGCGYTTGCEMTTDSMPPAGESYHIPLSMCLNAQISNLAVVGRCASSTHEGQSSVRIQTHCMVMGQGVGTAAALSLDAGHDLNLLNMPRLQDVLKSDGVYLEEIPAPKPAPNGAL